MPWRLSSRRRLPLTSRRDISWRTRCGRPRSGENSSSLASKLVKPRVAKYMGTGRRAHSVVKSEVEALIHFFYSLTSLIIYVSTMQKQTSIEWPTVALATFIYSSWLALTFLHALLPVWLLVPVGSWLIAWHSSLQHELLHGHPTRSQSVNRAIGLVRFSPLVAVAAL
jgi:hypothetical protein